MESNGLRGQESGAEQVSEVNALQCCAGDHRDLVGGNVEEGHRIQDVLVTSPQEPPVPELGSRHVIK